MGISINLTPSPLQIYTLRLIFALISMCVGIVLCLQFTTEVDPLGLNGSGGTGGGDDGRGGVGEGGETRTNFRISCFVSHF